MEDKMNKDNCYREMIEKFESIQEKIESLQECVNELQERYDLDDELRQGCPDMVAADKAAHKAIGEICLDALLDVEPKGEA
jgi:peptidoglycan hydrolase CwlO-like protein